MLCPPEFTLAFISLVHIKAIRCSTEVKKTYFMYQKVKFNIFNFTFNFTKYKKTLLSYPCLQIVSLGAGFDTLFFTLAREGLLKDTKYFEVSCM